MSHSHADTVPRGALITAGALVAFALTATTIVRVAHIPPAASPVLMRAQNHVAAVKTRDLRFIDRSNGSVAILDATSGSTASTVEPGSKSGFIRGVMRGLARDRFKRHIGNGPAFRLTLWQDGELSLADLATGRNIELGAFGGTNRAAFAALLK